MEVTNVSESMVRIGECEGVEVAASRLVVATSSTFGCRAGEALVRKLGKTVQGTMAIQK